MIGHKVKSVRALERGLDVLIEIQRSRAASLHELHQKLGLPKATLLRMLVTLASRGMIWQRMADGAYLPSSLTQAASAREDALDRLAEVASPHLALLSEKVRWPSVIAVPRLDHLEIIETNSALVKLDSAILGPVGAKLSYIHTATGRAYLSACDPRERATILARLRPADATAESDAAIEAIVRETQARGYSAREPAHGWPDRSRYQVTRDGRRSIAVPVRVSGQAIAAINITWPGKRQSYEEVVAKHLKTLQSTAEAVGRMLEAPIN